MAIKADKNLKIGDELKFKENKIGKILIGNNYPFALIKLVDPDLSEFVDKEIVIEKNKVNIIDS